VATLVAGRTAPEEVFAAVAEESEQARNLLMDLGERAGTGQVPDPRP
jgi:hypothetical protein